MADGTHHGLHATSFHAITKMEMHVDKLIAVLISVSILLAGCSAATYNVVIANGRVMDPETGFDRIAHVGINGDRIEAIDEEPLHGESTIDAAGLVVAPGLIDWPKTFPRTLRFFSQRFRRHRTRFDILIERFESE